MNTSMTDAWGMTAMTEAASCVDAALELLDRGISVIPIRPGEKRPLIPWTEYQKRLATPEEAEAWFTRWPDASLAMVTGAISGLWALDADGPAGLAWIRANAPTSGVYQTTPRGGWHALFRVPAGASIRNGVRVAPDLDVRGEGGYILIAPSPGYAIALTPGLDGWDDIPPWTPPLPGNVQLDLSDVRAVVPDQPAVTGSRNNTLAQQVGLWFAQGESLAEAVAHAMAWNERYCRPPLGQREVQQTVRSVHRTHTRNHPLQDEPESPEPVAIELGDSHLHPEIDAALLRPGGLLDDIAAYIDRASAASHPLFSLAAGIALLGAVAGQRVQTETGLRTNVYCICLGHSGAGKDAPHSAIERLLGRPSLGNLLGPNDPTSAPAILHWIKIPGQESTLLRLDEVGHILRSAQDQRSPAATIPALLMQLFSGADRPYVKSYAGADPIRLPWHHVCVYGSGTPARFWPAMSAGEAIDGFLARMLIFDSRHSAPLPREKTSTEPPQSLVDALERIHKIPVEYVGGNMAATPVPVVAPKTGAALAAFAPWALAYHERRVAAAERDPVASAVYGRAAEHAHKLALIHALSRHGHLAPDEGVDEHAVAWACALVDHLVEGVLAEVRGNVAESDWHRRELRVLHIIRTLRTPDRPGVPMREIAKRLHTPHKLVQELLESMIHAGTLVPVAIKGARGPAARLFAVAAESE